MTDVLSADRYTVQSRPVFDREVITAKAAKAALLDFVETLLLDGKGLTEGERNLLVVLEQIATVAVEDGGSLSLTGYAVSVLSAYGWDMPD